MLKAADESWRVLETVIEVERKVRIGERPPQAEKDCRRIRSVEGEGWRQGERLYCDDVRRLGALRRIVREEAR